MSEVLANGVPVSLADLDRRLAETRKAMQPATCIAIAALGVSLGSLVVSTVTAAKNYKKSKRDAFIQRRDRLFQTIADLNARNTEARRISARYEIVAVRNAGLPLRGEQAEMNTATTASIRRVRERLENGIEDWDESIETLHYACSRLTSETDAAQVERFIALAQVASEDLRKANGGHLSALHILETTNEIVETRLAELDARLAELDDETRQISLDFERGMKNLGS